MALWRWMESVVTWAQERVALIGVKAQAATEAASASKVAAVAASTAALAGGTAAVRSLDSDPARAAPDRSERVLERAAPADLLPRLPEDAPAVETHPTIAPPVEVAPAPGPPAPPPVALVPAPAPADPSVGDAPVFTPAPPSLPKEVTVPVAEPGSGSALSGSGEDEREIDPMTTPMDRPPGRMAPDPSPEEDP